MTQTMFVSFVPKPKFEHYTPESPRARRKLELMAIDPTCSGCGLPLTSAPLMDNSSHLVGDKLSCQNCVGDIKKSNRLPIEEIRVDLTPKGTHHVNRFRYEREREQIKARHIANGYPKCSHCGKELEFAVTANQAHMIGNQLACLEHRKIVRAAVKAQSANLTLVKAGDL